MSRFPHSLLVLVLATTAAACSSPEDDRPSDRSDGGTATDAGVDATPTQTDGGDPCGAVVCDEPNRAVCEEGECRCDPGYVLVDDTCEPAASCQGCIAEDECLENGESLAGEPCRVCDGTMMVSRPATFVCREAAGPCDTAESCDGASATCPDDVYMADERGPTACGPNGNGGFIRTCDGGQWTDTDVCDGADECADGDVRAGAERCGAFFSGAFEDDCAEGSWTPSDRCIDTSSATVLDVVPGPEGSAPRFIGSFQRNGDTIAIFATNGPTGWVPYATDGTTSGTEALASVHPTDGFVPPHIVDLGNGEALFAGGSVYTSLKLFRTDGTAAGTTTVGNAAIDSYVEALWGGGGLAVFRQIEGTGDNSVWATDGTAAGTVEIEDTFDGEYEILFAQHYEAVDRLIFGLYRPTIERDGLYCTDGTAAGTRSALSCDRFSIRAAHEWNGKLYVACSSSGKRKLMEIPDCTNPSREIVIDPATAPNPAGFAAMGEHLYFTAIDGATGRELWRIDRSGNPALVHDLAPGSDGSFTGGIRLVATDDAVFFIADDGSGRSLWKTDGTPSGATKLTSVNLEMFQEPVLAVVDGRIIFGTKNASGDGELWTTDGTVAGTTLLLGMGSATNSGPTQADVIGTAAFVMGRSATEGREIWATSGRPGEIDLAYDYVPGIGGGVISMHPTPGFAFVVGGAANATYGSEPLILRP